MAFLHTVAVHGNVTLEAAPPPRSPHEPAAETTLPATERGKPPIRVIVKTERTQNQYTTTNELPGENSNERRPGPSNAGAKRATSFL